MEFVEYVPGALATGWMMFKMVSLLRNGPTGETDDQTV